MLDRLKLLEKKLLLVLTNPSFAVELNIEIALKQFPFFAGGSQQVFLLAEFVLLPKILDNTKFHTRVNSDVFSVRFSDLL